MDNYLCPICTHEVNEDNGVWLPGPIEGEYLFHPKCAEKMEED